MKFKNGESTGLWIWLHENGQKNYEGTFKDVKQVSFPKRWNKDGSIKEWLIPS
tara:strand:- start:310 stop:468 length:159 start_codon:yes stop_codon:yes gene_type:complete